MELTGSTLVNKNMSCGKYANNSGSDEAARTSGGERGALFLSTHSLRPRGVGGNRGGGHVNRAKNTKHLLHRRRTVRGFRVYTVYRYTVHIAYIILYSVERRRAILKLPRPHLLTRRLSPARRIPFTAIATEHSLPKSSNLNSYAIFI